MKIQTYDKNISIHIKGGVEVGEELDIADVLLAESFVGVKQFINNLEKKEDKIDVLTKFRLRFSKLEDGLIKLINKTEI